MRPAQTVLLAAVAIAIALPAVLPGHLLMVAVVALLGCYMAQCWNIVYGYAGLFSLGHAVFFGIGAYTSSVLFQKLTLTPWVGIVAGAALSVLVGALVALLVFRYRVKGIYFALVTLALMEVFKGLADNFDLIGGSAGLNILMKQDPANFLFISRLPFYYIGLAMVVGAAVLTWKLERSRFGQQTIAAREDEDAAEACGISSTRCKTWAIVLSAGMTALAGSFYAQLFLFISPETTFTFDHQLTMMLGTMVGGAGTVLGPIVGSLLFTGLAEGLRHLPMDEGARLASASRAVYGLILVLIVFYLPGGLMSLGAKLRRAR